MHARWLGVGSLVFLCGALAGEARACATPVSVCDHPGAGAFALIEAGRPAPVVVEPQADPALRYAADDFAADLQRVSGQAAERRTAPGTGMPVIAGVLGHSHLIDTLASQGKLDVSGLAGTWEGYRQSVVERPFPGVPRALVVVGADRRGAVYGLYDLSAKIGVSPWYWFADVPVARRRAVYLTAGTHADQPEVKYRGFFINDEAPALSSWAGKHFGGLNADMYARVFELLLRLKGNTLWPAMWPPHAFHDDDPRNTALADARGVVMGTSHHEPLMRAHDEWHRHTGDGITGGAWDYARNGKHLRAFWRGGLERMMAKGDGRGYESLVTVGMRGDGDEAMAEGTAIPLLQGIVADQRRLIAEVTGRPASETPQVWALYKEVQDYYDHGMTVPDDVTLLFSDDNWGQIRRLPSGHEARAGGFGVYYHFDYVGAPRNYKWINTTQVEKTWQQMDLAWQRGARQLWMVNVGDIKPLEFPLDFFMAQAWRPAAMTPQALAGYPEAFARQSFGPAQARAIGELLTRYAQLAAQRKPELLDADTFPLGKADGEVLDGGAFGARVADWDALMARMQAVRAQVPAAQQSAYFQLVEHPISAFANLYHLYYAVAWNRRLAARGDARANAFADEAEAAYARDAALTARYHALEGGKWDGMMTQQHIGYTSWQQPDVQAMPPVRHVVGVATVPPRFGAPVVDAGGIEAVRYQRAVNRAGLAWQAIAHLGAGEGAMVALPQGRPPTTVADGVRLEYDIDLDAAGDRTAMLTLSPTLDTTGGTTLRVGVSLDDGPVQVLADTLVPAPTQTTTAAQRDWNRAVIENRRVLRAVFPGVAAGKHVLKVWRLDDNVVLERVALQ
ncbi:hypothetical protein ARC20_00615 [Stenotrophomonas panacihumi]|uniref:Gylcosyl hydrolase 115 C-terminal domain-containing protein n=1 Tax=Stenotrophomonas panacihumi TaxID=676599 RepID=A0A0R0ANR8_9GAMM|nr:hypothetical protein ARC20_00615 [Stenotrophomonas panacihumi]PTN55702.1 hypothetical protein C9J98_03745 [Stenotrophomonas panacihumi]